MASAALAEFGQIDVCVNNAGVGAIGRFEDIPLKEQAKVIETNLLGTLYGSFHAHRQFQKQGSGILINIASELGRESVPYYAAYTASKHGVIGLSDALRQEVKQAGLENIHICAIMPTAHDTPFFDHVANYSGHQVEPPTPLHDPENVAEAIVAAARDPSDEDIVGWDGTIKIAMKRFLPSAADALMGPDNAQDPDGRPTRTKLSRRLAARLRREPKSMLDAAHGGSSDHNQLPSAMRRCEYLRYSHSSASRTAVSRTRVRCRSTDTSAVCWRLSSVPILPYVPSIFG